MWRDPVAQGLYREQRACKQSTVVNPITAKTPQLPIGNAHKGESEKHAANRSLIEIPCPMNQRDVPRTPSSVNRPPLVPVPPLHHLAGAALHRRRDVPHLPAPVVGRRRAVAAAAPVAAVLEPLHAADPLPHAADLASPAFAHARPHVGVQLHDLAHLPPDGLAACGRELIAQHVVAHLTRADPRLR